MPLVLLESDGPVRTITLNAPERRNALDRPLLDELAAAIDDVAHDADAGALVVTGAGKAFCAGADLDGLFGDTTRPLAVLREVLKDVYASFLGLRDLTIPSIAAVQGAAIGAGLNIALACDVVVAGPRAGFGPTFTEIGLHPGGGCTFMLTERMGAAAATKALLDGDVIGADDALRLGIAQELVDDAQAGALATAHRWASRDRTVNAHVKRTVQIARTSDLAATVEAEAWAQASSLGSDRFKEFSAGFRR